MDDLISRQAATSIPILPKEHRKIFKSIDDAFETGWNEALSCVNMLPSVQPDHNADIGKKVEGDCISRTAAIDALTHEWDGMVTSVFDVIKSLPSAQPERKRGKWIPFDIPWYRCSECGAERENIAFMEYFCPNCGADMRGKQDETD